MNAIRAVVRGGRIETDEPLDLPDGTELRIPLPAPVDDVEEGWDTSPEAIAAWIERDKAAEPPNFDLAEWEAAMKWLKERERDTAGLLRISPAVR